MDLSIRQRWKNIKWKKILTTEITSSWKPSLQSSVLLYIAEMLQEGFQLIEIFQFLLIIFPKQEATFQKMIEVLGQGGYFYQAVHHMNVKGNVAYQIKVAESYGQFGQGLETIAKYIHDRDLQQKNMRKVMIYPILLFCLMILMMFGLRLFLLPQLNNFALDGNNSLLNNLIWFLDNLPIILLFVLGIGLISGVAGFVWYKRTKPLQRAQLYVRIPIIGNLVKLHYTHFFAYEFSQLFKIGYSVKQITETLVSQEQVPFLYDFGLFLQDQYLAGQTFSDSLKLAGVFSQEFPAVVIQGELLNQLAVKTRLYSQRILRRLYEEIEQKIKVTQSILFLIVGLSVVVVYLILMLPMLTMLETI